jgi:uncharacterized phage protein (TIGR01671 family)
MREIKFRAWDTVCNGYAENWKLYLNGAVSISDTWASNDVILEQYTGLKDKNGVEIYEGDNVKFHYFYQGLGEGLGAEERENEISGEIFMGAFGWSLRKIKGKHWEGYTGYNPEEGDATFIDLMLFTEGAIHEESFEVIGNIHQTT